MIPGKALPAQGGVSSCAVDHDEEVGPAPFPDAVRRARWSGTRRSPRARASSYIEPVGPVIRASCARPAGRSAPARAGPMVAPPPGAAAARGTARIQSVEPCDGEMPPDERDPEHGVALAARRPRGGRATAAASGRSARSSGRPSSPAERRQPVQVAGQERGVAVPGPEASRTGPGHARRCGPGR